MYYLLKWIKFSVLKNVKKIPEKWQKILEKSGKSQGILSVRKSGNPVRTRILKFEIYFRNISLPTSLVPHKSCLGTEERAIHKFLFDQRVVPHIKN